MLEWMAYERVEPFGAWRDNFHAALVATLIHNIVAKKPATVSQFFYTDPETAVEEKDKKMIDFLNALAGQTDD